MNTHLQLDEIFERYQEPDWVGDNALQLYAVISASLNDETTASQARDALLLVYPHVLTRGDVKKWGKMIHDALAVSLRQYNKTEGDSPSNYKSIYELYMTSGQSKSPETAIAKPVRRATRRQNPRAILDAYIGIFKLQAYQQTSHFTQKAVDGAIDLARLVNHPQLYARLYQALAYAYLFWGEYERSLDRAFHAYQHWVDNQNAEEAGLSAYAIAIAYCSLKHYDHAVTWLETAARHFSSTEYKRQHILISGEMGTVYFLFHQFDAAVQWYQMALDEARQIQDDYSAAMIQQGLGAVLIYQDKYELAEQSLKQAYTFWDKVHEPRQIAQVYHTMAYLTGRKGDQATALHFCTQAMQTLVQIPESHYRTFMTERVEQLRKMIEDGTDLREVLPS